ncbi:MAG TPA: hypothetical protein VLC29_06645, partial [Rhizomicrobium sp.]|nr:hypothetical protein [Rhizomicrobium sp.]
SMRAGLVDKIDVFTNGVRDQDVVYAQLVSKFGKPQVYSKTEQANLMGAKFDVIIAEWHRKDGANVTLFGTLDKFTNGSISASSAAAEEEERARAAAHPTPSL